MSERAESAIRAERLERSFIIGVGCIFFGRIVFFTKLAFVSTGVVKLLYFIVSKLAVVVMAAVALPLFALDVIVLVEIGPPEVFLVVVIKTKVFVMAV